MDALANASTFRIAWFLLPIAAGPGLASALDGASTPVAATAGLLLALGWGIGVVAVLVPRGVGLTGLRIVAPGGVAATVAAVVAEPSGATSVALAATVLVAAWLLLVPAVADHFIDGSSYGPERRMALRTPAPLWFGPIPLAWAAVVAGVSAGPLLLAAGRWLVGAVALAAGAPAAVAGARSLHQLARRWIVFVPAGLVVHDPLALLDPVAIPKRSVRAIGPALADTASEATDLSLGALGLVLELAIAEPTALATRGKGRNTGASVETSRVLFASTRPGALLAEAAERGLPVARG